MYKIGCIYQSKKVEKERLLSACVLHHATSKQGIITDLQPPLIPPGNLFSLIMEKQYDHWKTTVKCKQPSSVVVVFVLKKKEVITDADCSFQDVFHPVETVSCSKICIKSLRFGI